MYTFKLLSKNILYDTFSMSETIISKIKRQESWENHNCNMTEELMLTYEQLLQITKKNKLIRANIKKQAIHKKFKQPVNK